MDSQRYACSLLCASSKPILLLQMYLPSHLTVLLACRVSCPAGKLWINWLELLLGPGWMCKAKAALHFSTAHTAFVIAKVHIGCHPSPETSGTIQTNNDALWSICTYHHAYLIFLTSLTFLNSIIDDKVHEWIKATEYSSNNTTTIESHYINS